MPDLIKQLQEKGCEFDFFQAVSLLEGYFRKKEANADPLNSGKIKFQPDVSTVFPPGDIASIKIDQNGTLNFFLSFMGLLGISSPLPHYFTQYAGQYEKGGDTLIDFLSIFDHRIYIFFYRAWKKYRLINRLREDDVSGLFRKIAFLTGLSGKDLRNLKGITAYTGILALSSRSADGLKTMVSDFFGDISVSIEEWVPRWAPVHDLKQVGKDSILGVSTMIGTHIRDVSGKFRVILGPLEKDSFEEFLPGKKNISLLKKMITSHLTDPLDYDIVVKLKPTALSPVVLGQGTARLGISSSCGLSSKKGNEYSITIEGKQ